MGLVGPDGISRLSDRHPVPRQGSTRSLRLDSPHEPAAGPRGMTPPSSTPGSRRLSGTRWEIVPARPPASASDHSDPDHCHLWAVSLDVVPRGIPGRLALFPFHGKNLLHPRVPLPRALLGSAGALLHVHLSVSGTNLHSLVAAPNGCWSPGTPVVRPSAEVGASFPPSVVPMRILCPPAGRYGAAGRLIRLAWALDVTGTDHLLPVPTALLFGLPGRRICISVTTPPMPVISVGRRS